MNPPPPADVIGLDLLNSITKYPSIKTYHELGDKGRSTEKINVDFEGETELTVTEKIDGTNCRIVLNGHWLVSNDWGTQSPLWLIGSRNELLAASGDLCSNPKMGVVEELRDTADMLTFHKQHVDAGSIVVVYGELYGGKINKYKEYTGAGAVGFRVFDILILDHPAIEHYLTMDRAELAALRDSDEWRGQFAIEKHLVSTVEDEGLDVVPAVDTTFPTGGTVQEVADWLRRFRASVCTLDEDAMGRSEGVVVRDSSSTKIAKVRFDNYKEQLR